MVASASVETVTPTASLTTKKSLYDEVIVHPLVLLSVVDHYYRVNTKKRVVGVLLGTINRGKVDVTNSFAVPFEEDSKDNKIWYLDHNYLESMAYMFKKVSAKEKVIGFYSTGPKIKPNDIKIDSLMRRFCANPVFVVIDIRAGIEGIPVKAYTSFEEVETGGTSTKEIHRNFVHIKAVIGAQEAEEVGVEHLLREINDPSISSLANQIKHKMRGLIGLQEKLEEIHTYLVNVVTEKMPVNNNIIYSIQTIFNLLPNLNIEELVRALLVKGNDMHFMIYLSALLRSVISLHDLVQNKIQFKEDDYGRIVEDKKVTEEREKLEQLTKAGPMDNKKGDSEKEKGEKKEKN